MIINLLTWVTTKILFVLVLREEEGTIVMTNSKMLSRKVGKKSATGCAPYICSLL